MNTVLKHRLANAIQSALLLAGMAGLLGLLGWILAGPDGLVWSATVGALALWASPRVSPRLVLALYGAREIQAGQAPELYALVKELACRAGLPQMPRLYYVPSRVPNAFTVGARGNGAVTLTDGLLRSLALRELAGVLAHEIAHIRNNDLRVMGLADAVNRLTAFLSTVGQLLVVFMLPFALIGAVEFPVLPLAVLVLAPLASSVLELALSRTREYDADAAAAELTGDPEGLALALAKLERSRERWSARIFLPVADPALLRTHPPTPERIQRLLALVPRYESRFSAPFPVS